MSDGRCATCRHWGEPDMVYQRGRGFDKVATGLRACAAVPFYGDEPAGEHIGDVASALATVRDDEGYAAELLTRADFGCVLHEQKE